MWVWLSLQKFCTPAIHVQSLLLSWQPCQYVVQAFGTFSLTTRLDFKENSFHLVLENNEYLEETANLPPSTPPRLPRSVDKEETAFEFVLGTPQGTLSFVKTGAAGKSICLTYGGFRSWQFETGSTWSFDNAYMETQE